jgi:hypothetical protein
LINTFNDKLGKILSACTDLKSKQETKNTLSESVATVFWCKNYEQKENCCFNHWIGLPQKDGIEHPLYPYEEELFSDIERYNFLAIMKATGLGITEFFLRYAEHQCLIKYENAQVVILTGPNMDLAKIQIARIKKHLLGKINFKATDYEIRLPRGNLIKAFPSMNIDAARSLTSPKLILIDEAAFFGMTADEEVRAIAERYQAKSGAKVVIYSTPGLPEGMFYNLMKEEPSQYKRRYLSYNQGLVPHPTNLALTMYDPKIIEEAKKSPSFEREYNLQWGFGSGDIFDLSALEEISREVYDLYPVSDYPVLAVDPGYGSSKFAIVGAEQRDGIVYILAAQQFVRASQSDMITTVKSIIETYHYRTLVVDSSNPGFIAEFPNAKGKSFRERGQLMTDNAAAKVAKHEVLIHPKFEELLRQLRAVQKNEKGTPDKKRLTYDLGDAFHLALDEFQTTFYGAKLKDQW